MNKLVFWAWQIWGPPSYKECSEEVAIKILEHAYKKGVQVFDTAPVYGLGKSEERIWKAFSHCRKDIQIITKFWFDWGENMQTYTNFSPAWITLQLEKSLRRLKTDYIDIYLLHIPTGSENPTEILSLLNTLKKDWKIKHYGVCNMYSQQLQAFLHHPLSQVEYVQDFYNIIERKAEKLIFPYLNMAYSPLYRWLISSKNIEDLLKGNEEWVNMLLKNQELPQLYKKRKLYEAISQKLWKSMEEIAFDFLKNNPRVDNVILGSIDTKHIDVGIDILNN